MDTHTADTNEIQWPKHYYEEKCIKMRSAIESVDCYPILIKDNKPWHVSGRIKWKFKILWISPNCSAPLTSKGEETPLRECMALVCEVQHTEYQYQKDSSLLPLGLESNLRRGLDSRCYTRGFREYRGLLSVLLHFALNSASRFSPRSRKRTTYNIIGGFSRKIQT